MARILIIDNEIDFYKVVASYLTKYNHYVQIDTNLAEVTACLDSDSKEIVLLDVRMPDINALEILPQIKSTWPIVHVVVITALDDYREADLLYEAGVAKFFTKPVELPLLNSTIAELLAEKSPQVC